MKLTQRQINILSYVRRCHEEFLSGDRSHSDDTCESAQERSVVKQLARKGLVTYEEETLWHTEVNGRPVVEMTYRVTEAGAQLHEDDIEVITRRFNKVWKDGKTYIMWVPRHVAAVIDGTVVDWSRGKALRCLWLYEVVKKEEV